MCSEQNNFYKDLVSCSVGFYGVETLVGYFMPNPVYTYIY